MLYIKLILKGILRHQKKGKRLFVLITLSVTVIIFLLSFNDSFSSPIQVGSLTTWLNVSCGQDHVLSTKTDKTLWAWGSNNKGQLGINNLTNRSSPVRVGSSNTWLNVACGQYFSAANQAI